MKKVCLFGMAVLFLLGLPAWASDTMTEAIVTDLHAPDHVPRIWHSYDTGNSTLAETLAPGVAFELKEVRLHLDAASATAENFTITVDSITNAVYDTVLLAKDMNAVTNYVWIPDNRRFFFATDELDFAWGNSNTKTWGLEVLWQKTNM